MVTTTTLPDLPRRLPSADWIAVGVVASSMIVNRLFGIWTPGVGILFLAVFGPPLLRELGILKDTDEFTRGIVHRAGFHAFLLGGLLLAANQLLQTFSHRVPVAREGHLHVEIHAMWFAIIIAYLVSYLIQYWGPRLGVFRIILAAAAINLIETLSLLRTTYTDPRGPALLSMLAIVSVLVLLAFLVRSRPRLGGGVLLALLVVAVVFFSSRIDLASGAFWPSLSSLLQIGVLFGATGVALLHVGAQDEE